MLRHTSNRGAATAANTASRTFRPRNLLWPDPDVQATSPYSNLNLTTVSASAAANSAKNGNDDDGVRGGDGGSLSATPIDQPKPSLLLADNVSGLHETRVGGFFFPQTVDDVREVINRARRFGRKICMRGTMHCMGGHNVATDAFVIDFKFMKKIEIHPEKFQVTTEPGATWADLIVALNPHGQSPRTMQSYSSFAVGGTVAVNAHGITTDYSCVESVLSIDVLTDEGELLTCRHDSPPGSREADYFRHVIGGYGIFGIMVSITLKTTPNDSLLADSFMVPVEDFPSVYEGFLTEEAQNDTGMGGITIKLCRLNIITCETIQIYLFRRRGTSATVGQLTANNSSSPREMSTFNRLIYKWLLPPLKEARYQIEESQGVALDWTEALDKNSLMFETAEPLARLANPLFDSDETFILQEFFVPKKNFANWMNDARKVYKQIFENEAPNSKTRVQLLNTTIRYVHEDTQTALPYSYAKGGSFAFVLYYRMLRSEESIEYLKSIHQRFVEITLRCQGTYYLPYLHHHSIDELLQSYREETFTKFVRSKEKLDPHGLFDSNWFREYGLNFLTPEYKKKFLTSIPDTSVLPLVPRASNGGNDATTTPFTYVSDHRHTSFRDLMNNVALRTAFFSEFLVNVFGVASSPQKAESSLSRCVWDPRNKEDIDVYRAFKDLMDKDVADPISQAGKAWRQIRQLSTQKRELTDETMRVLTRLGKIGGEISDYVSIGDHGKLVRHLQRELKMYGKVRVLHEEPQHEDDPLVAVETGSSTPLGDFILVDYSYSKCLFPQVPDASADLVTMNQGLHHLPQCYLKNFLTEVERILRPGGIFITREHDATPDLIPMVDCAHSVFNALTGVSIENERREIRAFRPIAEWRRIITSVTKLQDTMIFEVQKGDPTVDIMITFFKPPLHASSIDTFMMPARTGTTEQEQTKIDAARIAKAAACMEPQLPFHQTIERLPEFLMGLARTLFSGVAPTIESFGDKIAGLVAPEEFKSVVTSMIRQYTSPLAVAAQRILQQTEHATCRRLQIEAFPSELFHGFFALENKVKKGKASAQEALVVTTVRGIMAALSGGEESSQQNDINDDDDEGGSNLVVDQSNEPIEMFHEEIVANLEALFKACPQITDTDYLLVAGFPEPIVDSLHSMLPTQLITITKKNPSGTEIHVEINKQILNGAATKLEGKIDSETWFEMKRHIKTICDEKTPLVFDNLLGRDNAAMSRMNSHANTPRQDQDAMNPRTETSSQQHFARNPWHALLTALLGSPLVKLPYAARIAARFYGVVEAGDLYDASQEMRIARRSRRAAKLGLVGGTNADGSFSQHLPQLARDEINRALDMLNSPVRSSTMKGDSIKNIYDVTEVLSCTYQGKDVLAIVKKKLYRRDAKTGKQFVCLEMEDGSHLDSIFGYGLTPMSHLFYGERTVFITYRSLTKVPTENLHHSATLVKRCLRQSNAANIRRIGNGVEDAKKMALHFYKLLEWMQVDICKDMANSLDHTPWYRYPFMGQMATYMKVLGDVSGVVFQGYGARAAFFSNGFSTAAVPALLMGLLFGQLSALAYPVRTVLGDSYDDSRIKSRVLIHNPECETNDKLAWPLSFRMAGKDITILPVHGKQLALVTMPIFGEFTTLLLDLARHTHQNKATILDIDGNANKIMIKARMIHDPTAPAHDKGNGETIKNDSFSSASPVSPASANNNSNSNGAAAVASPNASSPQQQTDSSKSPSTKASPPPVATISNVEKILRKQHGFASMQIISTYTATTEGVAGAKPAQLYDFAAFTVPIQELLDVIRACDQSGITLVQIFDFY